MSMHKVPLTALEETGLRAHGLPIGEPSQLADCFRNGVAYALTNQPADLNAILLELAKDGWLRLGLGRGWYAGMSVYDASSNRFKEFESDFMHPTPLSAALQLRERVREAKEGA